MPAKVLGFTLFGLSWVTRPPLNPITMAKGCSVLIGQGHISAPGVAVLGTPGFPKGMWELQGKEEERMNFGEYCFGDFPYSLL